MDPIQRLLDEHVQLMAMFAPMRNAVHVIAERGAAVLPDVLPAVRDVVQIMATDLLAHAQREDQVLFPAIESVYGANFGPTLVMRVEHEQIHAAIAQLQTMLKPAHVAALNANHLGDSCGHLLQLLDSHFGKEEHVLFPMARQALSPAVLRALTVAMEGIRTA